MNRINVTGKYPCRVNWITMKHHESGYVLLHNALCDEDVYLTTREAQYFAALDGNTDPYKVPGFLKEECEFFYEFFMEEQLIRTKKRYVSAGFIKLWTLYVPKKPRSKAMFPKIYTLLLMLSFLPVFLLGLLKMIHTEDLVLTGGNTTFDLVAGLIISIIYSSVLHEISHACACFCFSGRCFEGGIMWSGLYPGAYVLIDYQSIKNRFQKAEIMLAGVEMNILLAGINCLLIAYKPIPFLNGIFFYGVITNILLALLNLCFQSGMDGEKTISILMGKKGSIVEHAWTNVAVLFSGEKRKCYFRQIGWNAFVNLWTSVVIIFFQLLVPMLVIVEIGSIWEGIFG